MMSPDDWCEDEWEREEAATLRARAKRRERRLEVVWNVVLIALFVVLWFVIYCCFASIREGRRTERERLDAACPSGTASRVVDRVNQEPLVAACNRVADAVLGK